MSQSKPHRWICCKMIWNHASDYTIDEVATSWARQSAQCSYDSNDRWYGWASLGQVMYSTSTIHKLISWCVLICQCLHSLISWQVVTERINWFICSLLNSWIGSMIDHFADHLAHELMIRQCYSWQPQFVSDSVELALQWFEVCALMVWGMFLMVCDPRSDNL